MEQPRSRTRLAREERREQILDAAEVVLARREAIDVTFEEIADAAGVSRALVYNYFGDRHGLVEAIYLRSVHELDVAVTAALSSTRGAREAVAATVWAHLDMAAAKPAAYRHAAGETTCPGLAALAATRAARLALALGGALDGEIVARALLTATHAMVLGWLDNDRRDAERTAEVITAFIFGGLTAADRVGVHVRPTWPVPA